MRILQIVNSAYRCTIEEQDDPVIWITHAMTGSGASFSVLLRGLAVNYAIDGQDASGLAIGGRRQKQPPRLDRDIGSLLGKGVGIYVVREDCEDLGIDAVSLVAGVTLIARGALPELFDAHDRVWNW
jgi:hypothetical protein